MRDILLILVLVLTAGLGQLIISRIGLFLENNYHEDYFLTPDRDSVYIHLSEGKTGEDLSDEITRLKEANMDCTVIVCRDSDTGIIDYLKHVGCAVNFK